jgi:hypothetical protein
MAISSVTIPLDTINSLTERSWLPGVADAIWGTNTLRDEMYKNIRLQDGGTSVNQAIVYGEGPSGWYTGVSQLDLSTADIVATARYPWKQVYAGASIEWLEELINSGCCGFGDPDALGHDGGVHHPAPGSGSLL